MSDYHIGPGSPYDIGYSNGEDSVAADWHFALTEILGLEDAISAYPSETARALKAVLTDTQIEELNHILIKGEDLR